MMKKIYRLSAIFFIVFAFLMGSCSKQMKEYYEQESNYLTATGFVSHIAFDNETNALYLAFSDLEPVFDDNNFKIVGKNYEIIQENEIYEKIEIGSRVEFVTAPRYWGDGYVMPIVALSIHDEVLLNFEEGFTNFQLWLSEK